MATHAKRRAYIPDDATAGAMDAPEPLDDATGRARKKPGPKPDPTRRALKKCMHKLTHEQWDALQRAALERVSKGKATRLDGAEVLRLLLDEWIRKGAKAP